MTSQNNSSVALQAFTFEDTRVRAGLEDNEPWFVAADVAKALNYGDATHLLRALDPDEKGLRLVETPGGPQKMTTITEAGLYKIILKREAAYVKDPAARAMVTRFQWWVTHEVLPSLRKTGAYSLPQASAPVLSGKALLAAAVLEARKTIENLEAENEELKPKALFADVVGAGENTLTMGRFVRIA